MCDNRQDLVAMKKLFAAWNVEDVYELFREEDIGMDELKMMNVRHMHLLLQNYKMGLRIRFEHHFHNWRMKIGIPLEAEDYKKHYMTLSCSRNKTNNENDANETQINANDSNESHNIENGINSIDSIINRSLKRKRKCIQNTKTNNNHVDSDEAPQLSPQSCHNENSSANRDIANDESHLIPMPSSASPNHQATLNTDEEADMENCNFNHLSNLLPESINELSPSSEQTPKFPSKAAQEKCNFNLTQILKRSGARGMSIVKFYKEKKRLTNIHRSQLIQTIVEFFDENDYHLSLNASHNLEWEILKMFPTEKLEYYRTEKRGKLYVKFSNMKRYKRERSNKVKSEIDTTNTRTRRSQIARDNIQTDGLVDERNLNGDHNSDFNLMPEINGNINNGTVVEDDENIDTTYVDWPICAEPEIVVKEENLSGAED